MVGDEAEKFASMTSLDIQTMITILSRTSSTMQVLRKKIFMDISIDERDDVLEDFVRFCERETPKFPNVKVMYLGFLSELGERGLRALAAFLEGGYVSGLADLHIAFDVGHEVAGEAFRKIFQSGSLNDSTSLHLRFNSEKWIENSVYEAFAKSLQSGHLSKVESLKFSGPFFGKSFGSLCECLADVLAAGHLASLGELDLLIDAEAKIEFGSLSKSLQQRNLKSLRLAVISELTRTTELLAEALVLNPLDSLTEIDLSYSKFQDSTIVYLAKAFQSGHGKGLQSLDLSRNKVRAIWPQTLAQAGNKVGDAGAQALAEAFDSGNLSSLEVLDLKHNLIGSKGATAILQSLQSGKCPKVHRLNFSSNNIDVDDNLLVASSCSLGQSFGVGPLLSLGGSSYR